MTFSLPSLLLLLKLPIVIHVNRRAEAPFISNRSLGAFIFSFQASRVLKFTRVAGCDEDLENPGPQVPQNTQTLGCLKTHQTPVLRARFCGKSVCIEYAHLPRWPNSLGRLDKYFRCDVMSVTFSSVWVSHVLQEVNVDGENKYS